MKEPGKFRTRTIEAGVLRRNGGPLEIETVEMEGPRHDEVLVRVAASGVCHTDISFIEGWSGRKEPIVLGHEGAGRVEEVGGEVRDIGIGDHVVLSYQSCGRCFPCRDGRPTECEHFGRLNFGFQRGDGTNALYRSGVRGHFFGQSSFATYVLATQRNLVVVPKDLPLKTLAPLGCGMQTGAGAVINSLKVSEGNSVVVIGSGSVGLAAIMAARIVGAHPIIAIDIKPKRLKLALDLGATHVIDSGVDDVAACVGDIVGNGVDYVLEITGEQSMQRLAVGILKPLGTVAIFSGEDPADDLPDGRKMLSIIQGSAVPQRFIPELIALYRSGEFPFDRLITYYDFHSINDAIADSRRGDTIKPVVRMNVAR